MNNQINNYASKGEELLNKAEDKALDIISTVEDKSLEAVEKATSMAHDMINKSNTSAHNAIDKVSDLQNNVKKKEFFDVDSVEYEETYLDDEYDYTPQTPLDYVKSYAIEHPVVTATAVSATVLAGASLVNSKTRKVTVPIAKYAIRQQAKFTLGVGMLAMATYLTSRID